MAHQTLPIPWIPSPSLGGAALAPLLLGALLTALLLAGCAAPGPPSPAPGPEAGAAPPEQGPAGPETSTPQAGDLAAISLSLEPVITGLEQPVFVTHANQEGRIYVLERPGRIWTFDLASGQSDLFLDIQDRVGSGSSEQGLLGLAFAPDFPDDGRLFVNYTDSKGDTVVARFLASPDQADPTSEALVLALDQPARNHNGGMVLFGPDRMLWVGTGDGGRANDVFGNGQNPATLLGKMLRLDVLTPSDGGYAIPEDNPWVEETWNGQEVQDEIWAVGLRNPWRYSFDRATGDLWIGDVGQNQFEEIDRVSAAEVAQGGINFGWPIMEGRHCFQASACDEAGLRLPLIEYDHRQGNCSVTGGYVYRGTAYPALDGVYLYGDFCSGQIWAYDTRRTETEPVLMLDTDLQISSFGEDAQGNLYVVDLRGSVQRVIPAP